MNVAAKTGDSITVTRLQVVMGVARCATGCAIHAGSLRFPRYGTGARYGESDSASNRSSGTSLLARVAMVAITLAGGASWAAAQQPESIVPLPTVQRAADTVADALKKPPLSPRGAFLTSLLLPGYAQSRLNRSTSSVLYAAFEVLSIGMARKAAQDLSEAKRAGSDSVVISYGIDPTSGQPVPTGYAPSRFTGERIKARRTHYEDWIAAIVFNHLISAVDAYVAAQLWDFDANVSVASGQRTATISAHRSF